MSRRLLVSGQVIATTEAIAIVLAASDGAAVLSAHRRSASRIGSARRRRTRNSPGPLSMPLALVMSVEIFAEPKPSSAGCALARPGTVREMVSDVVAAKRQRWLTLSSRCRPTSEPSGCRILHHTEGTHTV